MPSRKAQLVSPLSGDYIPIEGLSVTGVITAIGGISAPVTGAAQSITDGANLDLGTVTATTFVGDSIGTYRAAGLTNTGAGTSNLNVGVVTATSISGVVTGNITGTASSIISGSDLTVGVATAVTWLGDGSGITGAGSSAFIGQAVTAQAGTTTIDLSAGNIINFTHSNNTTVAFANTGTANRVTFIRTTTENTLAWPASIKWSDDSTPTLISNTRSSARQIFNLTTADAGVTWYGWESIKNDPQTFTLWSWGYNSDGQLGQSDTNNRSSPIQISGTTWLMANNGATMVYDSSIIQTKSDGTIWGWGINDQGGLGQDNIIKYSSPTQIGTDTNWAVGSFGRHVLWTKTDGSLWTWGRGLGGQLGLNQEINYSSPVQVGTENTWATSYDTGGKIAAAESGNQRNSGAIKTDGTLWVWGYNIKGVLGQNDTITRSSPIQIPGGNWSSISFGYGSAIARKTDGTAWSWGSNSTGMLGHNQGPTGNYSSPVQIDGNWASVSLGRTQACGVTHDGKLFTWGDNDKGELGLNEAHPGSYSKSSPTQVGTDNTWSTKRWAAGNIGSLDTTTFLKTDGTIWSWGYNPHGQLGQDTSGFSTMLSSPTQVGGPTSTNWGGVTRSGRFAVAHQFTP